MSDVVALPAARAQFFCTEGHGATNEVIALAGRTYCLPCTCELVQAALPEALRTTDFTP